MEIKPIARAAEWFGHHQGEHMHLSVRTAGTMFLSPVVMIYAPGPDTEEAKNEKKYAALRQPVSGIISAIVALSVMEPVKHYLGKLAMEGKLSKDMMPDLSFKLVQKGDTGILNIFFKKMFGKPIQPSINLSADHIIKTLGNGILPEELTAKIQAGFNDSLTLKKVSREKELVEFEAARLAEKFGNPALTEGEIEKKITKQVDVETIFKDYNKLADHWKPLSKRFHQLKQEYKIVEQRLTTNIKSIKDLKILNKKQLHQFQRFITPKFPSIFDKYVHIAMWFFAVVTLPVANTILNFIYPQVIKFVAPNLDKAVRAHNTKAAGDKP